MESEFSETFAPKNTATGLLLLAIGLTVTGVVAALTLPTALSTTSVQEQLSSGSNTLWLTVLSCLSPIALLLGIIGMFMIAGESKKFDKSHERLAWFGTILYVFGLVASLGVSIPLSFTIASQGSLSLALLSQWLTVALGVFTTVGLALVLYPYAGEVLSKVILAISGLEVVANLVTTAVSLSGAHITELTIMNQTSYTLETAKGPVYSALSICVVAIAWVMAAITITLAVRYRRQVSQASLESVV